MSLSIALATALADPATAPVYAHLANHATNLTSQVAGLVTGHVAAVPAAGNDWFTKIGSMTSSAKTAAIDIAGLLAVILVVFGAWKSRGAIAGVITSFIAAALFFWMASNVGSGEVSQPITDTIKGAPVVPSTPGTGWNPPRPAIAIGSDAAQNARRPAAHTTRTV